MEGSRPVKRARLDGGREEQVHEVEAEKVEVDAEPEPEPELAINVESSGSDYEEDEPTQQDLDFIDDRDADGQPIDPFTYQMTPEQLSYYERITAEMEAAGVFPPSPNEGPSDEFTYLDCEI